MLSRGLRSFNKSAKILNCLLVQKLHYEPEKINLMKFMNSLIGMVKFWQSVQTLLYSEQRLNKLLETTSNVWNAADIVVFRA